MEKQLFLKADPLLTYSINTQLKEQIKWLIGMEKIKPGEMLPPAQQLADTLGVNRNTVNFVYTQLKDEGIVSIHKGRGTQVLDNATIEDLIAQRKPMAETFGTLVHEAEERGWPLEPFMVAGLAFAQLFDKDSTRKTKVLFLECREHDHLFYRSQIEALTGAQVIACFMEDLQENPAKLDEWVGIADAVITTLNHDEETKRLVGSRKPVIAIGATVNFSLLMKIAGLASGSKVGFVCLGRKGGQWMAQRAKDAGITHIEAIAAGVDDRDRLLELVGEADAIFASSAVYEDVNRLAPEKTVHFPLQLEKSSEKLLTEYAQRNG